MLIQMVEVYFVIQHMDLNQTRGSIFENYRPVAGELKTRRLLKFT